MSESGTYSLDNGKNTEGKVSLEQVQRVFRENGTEVSIEQAREVLEFIHLLAGIAVRQVLAEENAGEN